MTICELVENINNNAGEIEQITDSAQASIALIKISGTTVYKQQEDGSLVYNQEEMDKLGSQLQALVEQGIMPIIIHGGGNLIDYYSKAAGLEVVKVGGSRYTDRQTLEGAVLPAISDINEKIVQMLIDYGLHPASTYRIFGAEQVKRKDLGYVGTIKSVNSALLTNMLYFGQVPVIACIGYNEAGQAYNINADKCAAALAEALQPGYVFMITSTGGIKDKDGRIIETATPQQLDELIAAGTITDGMQMKAEQSKKMIAAGLEKIYILDTDSIAGAASGNGARSYTIVRA